MKKKITDFSTLQHAWVYGFSYRKFKILQSFLPNCRLTRSKDLLQLPVASYIFVWGAIVLPAPITSTDYHIIRVEDGFLRSAGLGAALHAPASWVFDEYGIYFDATQPSRLEQILAHTDFDDALLQRAEQLSRCIIQQGLSKYNLAETSSMQMPTCITGKKILAIGQVEGDASLQYGSPQLKFNQDFLQEVRKHKPNDFIVYRPHPDVSAGWRRDALDQQQALKCVDLIRSDGDIVQWLEWADEVHVMTSLTGFEALLRQKVVYCYGVPFYAGWGLTQDLLEIPRRQRHLSLPELVAGTLILYPKYRSLLNLDHVEISAEMAIDELIQLRQQPAQNPWHWLQPILKRVNVRRDV